MDFFPTSSIALKNWFLQIKRSPNILFSKDYLLTFVSNYRIWAKKSIQRYSIDTNNFEMFLNLSLFTFAFSQMIWFRYKENSSSFFLKNTFPGVCLPSQTLSWDTFSTFFLDNENLKLKKIDFYPDSILLSPDSNRYFNQKLLDIGVLPIKTSNKNIGKRWSSSFSYRLQDKNYLFRDEFPSKLNSHFFSQFVSQENEFDIDGVPFFDKETESLNEPISSNLNKDNNNWEVETQANDLFKTKFLRSSGIKKENELIKSAKVLNSELSWNSNKVQAKANGLFHLRWNGSKKTIKFPDYFINSESTNQKIVKFGNNFLNKKFFFKGYLGEERKNSSNDQHDISSSAPNSFQTHGLFSEKLNQTSKRTFLSNQIINYSYQLALHPFSSLDSIFEGEFDSSGARLEPFERTKTGISGISTNTLSAETRQINNVLPTEELFSDVCSQELVSSFDSLNNSKPLSWVNSRLRSGFLYPDNININFLIHQTSSKKSTNFHVAKNGVHIKKEIFQPNILPIEVPFQGPVAGSSFQDFHSVQLSSEKISHGLRPDVAPPRREFKTFGLKYRPISLIFQNHTFYEGDGLVKNNLTLDLDLSNRNEVNKWAKKYFSPSNFLTDRKDGFFGYSETKRQSFLIKKNLTGENVSPSPNLNRVQILESRAPLQQSPSLSYLNEAELKVLNQSNNGKIKEEKIQEVLVPIEIFKQVAVPTEKYYYPEGKIRNSEIRTKPSISLISSWEFFKSLPVIVCNESWQIPYLEKKEWETIASLSEKPNEPKESFTSNDFDPERIELSIPLMRIAVPTSFQCWPLVFTDYKPDALQGFFQNTNFAFHFLPWSRSQWTPNLLSKRHFGDLYKRETTVFSNKPGKNSALNGNLFFTTCFNDHWEPFTLRSWLIISQICFVLFALKVCESCYQQYGKESLSFLLEALEALGVVDENFMDDLKDTFQIEKTDPGFRILKSINKRFKDVAGIDGILPDLSEIVWFLRNSGRSFKIGKVIPKGILFIGPPGTGKTFLASAIAGEAEVPVLVQSGSSLSVPEKPGKGAERLKNLFYEARQLSPCIIFIDEIDTLGEKREHVTGNPMGHGGMLEALGSNEINSITDFDNTTEFSQSANEFLPIGSNHLLISSLKTESKEVEASNSLGSQKPSDQLNILTQFLVEMDGLESREGVIVIGATNRPGVLDPAFTRPGRFDQIIKLEFPAKQKRIEILKLYSKNLGIASPISWNYLASRTEGCSAADLSAAMNESSIQAILKDTTHTIETIEQGLDFIQSSTRQKSSLLRKISNSLDNSSSESILSPSLPKNKQDPFFLQRLAFSQAGKAVLFTLLPQHPSCIFVSLSTPLQSSKSENKLRKIESSLTPFSTRFQLENSLIGLYAGKACELFVLFTNSHETLTERDKTNNFNVQSSRNFVPVYLQVNRAKKIQTLWESDLNKEEMRQATFLSQSMISKWYFYSKKISLQKWNSITSNQNEEDIKQPDSKSFFKNLAMLAEMEPIVEQSEKNAQKMSLRAWWQSKVIQQTSSSYKASSSARNWYRIYLPDPEQNTRNEEFVPADEYYHSGKRSLNLKLSPRLNRATSLNSVQVQIKSLEKGPLQNLSFVDSNQDKKNSAFYWNDLYKNNRDSLYQALVLSSFNKAFSLLNKNREIIDFFADYLLRYEVLREDEISSHFVNFNAKPRA